MKKSTRILLIGGIVGAATLVAKLMKQKNKSIDELLEMNNQKVDIIRDLNEMLDFSEEAIEKSKELASTYRIAAKNAENIFISKLMQETKRKIYIKLAEEHEQLAEWLEELKELRSMVKCNAFTDGYNKGIDDFLEIADKMEREDVLYYAALDEAAEQLKEGDNHGH